MNRLYLKDIQDNLLAAVIQGYSQLETLSGWMIHDPESLPQIDSVFYYPLAGLPAPLTANQAEEALHIWRQCWEALLDMQRLCLALMTNATRPDQRKCGHRLDHLEKQLKAQAESIEFMQSRYHRHSGVCNEAENGAECRVTMHPRLLKQIETDNGAEAD